MIGSSCGIKSGLMRHVEDVFGAPLDQLLADWYDEGLTPPRIAARLGERGIDVTDQCVRNWTRRFGLRRGWVRADA